VTVPSEYRGKLQTLVEWEASLQDEEMVAAMAEQSVTLQRWLRKTDERIESQLVPLLSPTAEEMAAAMEEAEKEREEEEAERAEMAAEKERLKLEEEEEEDAEDDDDPEEEPGHEAEEAAARSEAEWEAEESTAMSEAEESTAMTEGRARCKGEPQAKLYHDETVSGRWPLPKPTCAAAALEKAGGPGAEAVKQEVGEEAGIGSVPQGEGRG